MKVIKYTLTAEGTIPTYVLNGGHLPVANNNAWPQDLDLIGSATDDAPGEVFATKEDLLAYVTEQNFEFKILDEEPIPAEVYVNNLWAEFTK